MLEAKESVRIACDYCGKSLQRNEMVRYRGAISCRSCSENARERDLKKLRYHKTWLKLGAAGSMAGVFIGTVIQWTQILGLVIVPEISLIGLSTVLLMTSFGFFGLYLISEQKLVLAPVIAGLLSSIALVIQYFFTLFLPANSEIQSTSAIIIPIQLMMMAFFFLAGLTILLTRQYFDNESLTAASGALFLVVGSTLFGIPIAPTLLFAFSTLLFADEPAGQDFSITEV